MAVEQVELFPTGALGVVGVALLLAAVTQVWLGVAVARSATGVLPAE